MGNILRFAAIRTSINIFKKIVRKYGYLFWSYWLVKNGNGASIFWSESVVIKFEESRNLCHKLYIKKHSISIVWKIETIKDFPALKCVLWRHTMQKDKQLGFLYVCIMAFLSLAVYTSTYRNYLQILQTQKISDYHGI